VQIAAMLNPGNQRSVFPSGWYDQSVAVLRAQYNVYKRQLRPPPAVAAVQEEAAAENSQGFELPADDDIRPTTRPAAIEDELTYYLHQYFGKVKATVRTAGGEEERREPWNIDLQAWWEGHARALPVLARLAREVLSIPATSSSVERQFSSAKLIMAERPRGRMKQTTQEMWVYLRQNIETAELTMFEEISEKQRQLIQG
jgi:hypothetical protein